MVDIVHDQVDLALLAELHDLGDELGFEDLAGGVVGAVDDDRLGVGGDRLFDILHARLEGAVLRGNDARHAVDHLDHLGIGHPVGREDDDFILRVEQRVQDVVQSHLGPGGDDHVLRGDQLVVILLGVADDGLLKEGSPSGGEYLTSPELSLAAELSTAVMGVLFFGSPMPRLMTGSPRWRMRRAVSLSARVGDSWIARANWLIDIE